MYRGGPPEALGVEDGIEDNAAAAAELPTLRDWEACAEVTFAPMRQCSCARFKNAFRCQLRNSVRKNEARIHLFSTHLGMVQPVTGPARSNESLSLPHFDPNELVDPCVPGKAKCSGKAEYKQT